MQPYANLNKRWRSAGIIHKFSPTPRRIRAQLTSEMDKMEPDQEKVGLLKSMLSFFRKE